MIIESTTMSSPLSGALGEFWLPTDKSNVVSGILTIEPESNTRKLLLSGHSFEPPLSSSVDDGPTIIHGRIGGTLVTFVGCFCTKMTVSSVSTLEYHVPTIVSGVHITDEFKRVVRRVYLSFDSMHIWVPPRPIKYDLTEGKRGWKDLDLSLPPKPLIERSDTYFGSIELYKHTFFYKEQYKLDIRSESTFSLTYPNGASIQDVIEHCGCIRSLAAMVTGTLCDINLLELKVSLLSAYKNHKIDLYPSWVEDRITKKPSEFGVITYKELGGIDVIAKCLNNCYQNRHNAAVLRNLGSFWRSDVPYNESKFLSMTVALEHLHKSLNQSNGKLEDQLSCIVYPIADDISRFVPDIKWLGKKSVRYRAWAAHANSDDPPEGLLFLLMGSLYLCIMLRYTHDLEADIKTVCDKMYFGHRWFREWDNQLSMAMKKYPL